MVNIKKGEKIAVLYHADCSDGFGSAYSAWKKFGDKAIYLPVYHQTSFPESAEGAHVFLIDFAYSPEELKRVKGKIKSLTIIDHHKSAEQSVALADEKIFDMNHSGSALAWTYFFPKKFVPKLLQYVEDQDLWKFILPDSREINRAIDYLYKFDFKIWDKLVKDFETREGLDEVECRGRALLEADLNRVEKIVNDAEEVVFEGIKCLSANSPILNSYVGEALVKKLPPVGIIWHRRKGRIRVSLRGNGTVDVSELAEKYGGGGHKSSAGFYIDGEKLERILGI